MRGPRETDAHETDVHETGARVSTAGIYPMRIVTRLTGLTPDTIRAWERRYHAIAPDRTGGNARRYRDADIARLTRLAALTAQGHSISALAALTDEALDALALRPHGPRTETSPTREAIERYLEAVVGFDAQLAEERLMRAASILSPREVALELVAPLMREVGERWHDGALNVAQEHLVSAHARALLGSLLRSHGVPKGAPRMLTAAPPGHAHDIGAMIAAILCTTRGVVPVHLGADVPYPDLLRATRDAGADVVTLSVARTMSEAELDAARAGLPAVAAVAEVWVGAPTGHPLAALDGVRAFDTFEAFDRAVLHRFFSRT